jgi:molecular chaperone HscC
MSAHIVGIDLGTTFSLVATLRGKEAVILPNALGELLTPSAVSVDDDGTFLIGAPARARATTAPSKTVLEWKRDMGTDRTYAVGSHTMTPQQLSALVLSALKRDAEEALGAEVTEAVVTVPAYFGDLQRQATRDAGAIAGLRVDRIINEPTAAALAFGLHQRARTLKAAVLDLGGGTFDVTVLEITDGVIEIQSSAGDARLGGADFDVALAKRLAKRIRETYSADPEENALAWARLLDAAEQAKKRLTDHSATTVALPGLPIGRRAIDVELGVSREEAEEAWRDLLLRVRGPVQRALSDASLSGAKIDEVLLVGGSSRMPCVARFAAQIFGRLPQRGLPPDEAVAMGAAVQAALKAGDAAVDDMVVTDVAPFTLGLAVSEDIGAQYVHGIFSPILDRGTVIPASRVKRFHTMRDNQTHIRLEVFQGEHSLCRDNTKLGEYSMDGVPPAPAGEQAIDVRFTYDPNGILDVDMTLVSTGKAASFVIERTPGRLSPEQLAEARKANARLKIHPRELLPNAAALTRAEALYVELIGGERERLGQLITAFRAALEGQDEGRGANRRPSRDASAVRVLATAGLTLVEGLGMAPEVLLDASSKKLAMETQSVKNEVWSEEARLQREKPSLRPALGCRSRLGHAILGEADDWHWRPVRFVGPIAKLAPFVATPAHDLSRGPNGADVPDSGGDVDSVVDPLDRGQVQAAVPIVVPQCPLAGAAPTRNAPRCVARTSELPADIDFDRIFDEWDIDRSRVRGSREVARLTPAVGPPASDVTVGAQGAHSRKAHRDVHRVPETGNDGRGDLLEVDKATRWVRPKKALTPARDVSCFRHGAGSFTHCVDGNRALQEVRRRRVRRLLGTVPDSSVLVSSPAQDRLVSEERARNLSALGDLHEILETEDLRRDAPILMRSVTDRAERVVAPTESALVARSQACSAGALCRDRDSVGRWPYDLLRRDRAVGRARAKLPVVAKAPAPDRAGGAQCARKRRSCLNGNEGIRRDAAPVGAGQGSCTRDAAGTAVVARAPNVGLAAVRGVAVAVLEVVRAPVAEDAIRHGRSIIDWQVRTGSARGRGQAKGSSAKDALRCATGGLPDLGKGDERR